MNRALSRAIRLRDWLAVSCFGDWKRTTALMTRRIERRRLRLDGAPGRSRPPAPAPGVAGGLR